MNDQLANALDIAAKMLGLKDRGELPYKLWARIERAYNLVDAVGGMLVSRQVIASIVIAYEALEGPVGQ